MGSETHRGSLKSPDARREMNTNNQIGSRLQSAQQGLFSAEDGILLPVEISNNGHRNRE